MTFHDLHVGRILSLKEREELKPYALFHLNCKFFTSLFMFYHHQHGRKDDLASGLNAFCTCIIVSSFLPNSKTKISFSRTSSFPSASWQLVQKLCSEADFATRVDSIHNHDGGCVNSLLLTTVIFKGIIIIMKGSSPLKIHHLAYFSAKFQDISNRSTE